MVIKKAKKLNNDTLIRNSHNHIKTTWDIINRESGRNKKRNELLALKFGNKKILINKLLQKL